MKHLFIYEAVGTLSLKERIPEINDLGFKHKDKSVKIVKSTPKAFKNHNTGILFHFNK